VEFELQTPYELNSEEKFKYIGTLDERTSYRPAFPFPNPECCHL